MTDSDPRLEGYEHWEGVDPFEDYVGPLYYKRESEGGYRCAFIIGEKHVNGQRGLHGGMMMTFADYALFMISRDHLEDDRAVTVSFTSDFCSRGELGDLVESTGEVVHTTRKMLFLRGTVFTGDRVILRYSGVLKRVGKRDKAIPTDAVYGE